MTLTRFAAVAKAFSHPISEPREKEELPGLKLLRPEATAVSESSVPNHSKQLALMDRQPDASAETVEEAIQAEAPSGTVEKLKEALNTQKAAESHAKKGQKLTPKENAKKRGKTADLKESQVTSVKKKPAGKVPVHRKPASSSSQGMKRPAAAQTADYDEKRRRVLKLVPAAVL